MDIEATHHLPVMLEEVASLAIKGFVDSENFNMLDCTLGGGGHAEELLRLDGRVNLIGFDRDFLAITRVTRRLSKFQDRFKAIQGNFSDLEQLLTEGTQFGFILADLGFSSDQLDDQGRGFSFKGEGPLDMRLDQSQSLTAEEVVNEYELSKLVSVFKRGGVRRGARQIGEAIVSARPLKTTTELERVVTPIVERMRRKDSTRTGGSSHPATVVFQALRMEVNDELNSLKKFLHCVAKYLAQKGVLAVISFHSGEDKLVAQTMRRWARVAEVPDNIPLKQLPPGLGDLLTKKALAPSDEEQSTNPRARSARMRVFQRGELG